ncbi:BON domain-containing protein [Phenylobacterium sp.]|uniref:BON domain-containing protein n=1 Tax=Phenylobacterium sp. TaxID=1871053 RepID=UPI0025FB5821|nr:BON domain-containing protein [Phenylobacterium sp.]
MRREDWRELERERLQRLRERDRDDYGQADYSDLYGYDPRTRSGYRAYDDGRRFDDGRRLDEARAYDDGRPLPRRSWEEPSRRARGDGPSDRVLWAVIMERLDDERRLDLREVEVDVHDGEVTLNGTVKHKSDKRRIEDIADIEGVRNVQNNLRVREHSRRWTFL